jgi:hypothetical protein
VAVLRALLAVSCVVLVVGGLLLVRRRGGVPSEPGNVGP